MIQDIMPNRLDNTYKNLPVQPEDKVLIYDRQQVFVIKNADSSFRLPSFDEVKAWVGEVIYYLAVDQMHYYGGPKFELALLEEEKTVYEYLFVSVRNLKKSLAKYDAYAAAIGMQLNSWYRSRRFCGGCGHALVHAEHERMMKCPSCQQMEYPKISPAVIVGLRNGNHLLLSKYADRDYKRYALLAGFAEVGEEIEETVKREVMEEVGLKVKNIQYYMSQPWPYSDTLLMGFFADLDGSPEIHLDTEELALAEWVDREALKVVDEDFSLTNKMMVAFKEGTASRINKK